MEQRRYFLFLRAHHIHRMARVDSDYLYAGSALLAVMVPSYSLQAAVCGPVLAIIAHHHIKRISDRLTEGTG